MSTVRVYKSTDPGAPPHPSATRGSMAALLRACLVTGYGSGEDFKAPAGWEEPFAEAGNIACFRALEGARQFYQIDDTQADADVTVMRSFESMSDVATGQGQWGNEYFGKWYSATYPGTAWIVAADERTVYVWLMSRGGMIPHGFGEYDSLLTDDPYNSFVAGHESPGYLPYSSSTAVAHLSTSQLPGTSGNNFDVHKSLCGVFGAQSNVVAMGRRAGVIGSDGTWLSQPDIDGLNFMTSPLFISCRTVDENGLYLYRGKFRGLFAPMASLPVSDGTEITVDGRVLLAINHCPYTSSYEGQLLLDITGSWD